jgi:MYXO-CTERM domain-containing protein
METNFKRILVGMACGSLLVSAYTSNAFAQECDVDGDCGHGFVCLHHAASTATTGTGGSSASSCGDAICDLWNETVESCPEDCDKVQECVPVECTSNADCAAGYECALAYQQGSGTSGGSGGSNSSSCGNLICEDDENEQSCPDDCADVYECRVIQTECLSNADCAEGFHCYVDVPWDPASSATSIGGSGGAAVEDEATTPAPDYYRYCREDGQGPTAVSSQGASSTSAGGGTGGTDGESNQASASGDASGDASGSDGNSSGGASASATGDADGNAESDAAGGCSVVSSGSQPDTWPLAALALGAILGWRRRS